MHQQPGPAPNIVAEELDDEVCLYRPDVDEVLVLNYTASDIWRLADGVSSVEAIATALARKYPIDYALLRDEVARVIADLCERGFLIDAAASSSPT